jgi:hypothetical protein
VSKLRVKYKHEPVMEVHRSKLWGRKMVYVVLVDRPYKYIGGRSRVVYIGTTKKGEGRPASNAAKKSLEAFDKIHGVKSTHVIILVTQKRQSVETWAVLESALLIVFKSLYGQLPKFNKRLERFRRIEDVQEYFQVKRLWRVLRGFER